MIQINQAIKNLILFLLLFGFGTGGYMIIEGWDVIDSMFMATNVKGQKGRIARAIPIDQVVGICEKYNVLHLQQKLIGSP